MKKLVCLLLMITMLAPVCLAESDWEEIKVYPLSESGEAIVDDVDFRHQLQSSKEEETDG